MATKKDKGGTTGDQTTTEKPVDDRGYVTAVLTPDMYTKLKAQAEAEGVSPRVLARRAVLASLTGEQPPVKAAIIDGLLAKIEGRVADLDRKIDACAIAAVRVADRVAAIAPTSDKA